MGALLGAQQSAVEQRPVLQTDGRLLLLVHGCRVCNLSVGVGVVSAGSLPLTTFKSKDFKPLITPSS